MRQYASRYLARVEAGEELAVTHNGRLVARLVRCHTSRGLRSCSRRRNMPDAVPVILLSRRRRLRSGAGYRCDCPLLAM